MTGSDPRCTTVESALRLATWPASATCCFTTAGSDIDPSCPKAGCSRARHIDADVRGAFAASDSEPILPGGWYRNQFWFVPGPSGDILLCLGIHGQMVFVDRATRTVAVKLSSWPTPQDPAHLVDTIRAFAAVGRHLSGLEPVGDAAAARPTGPSGIVEGQERGHG